MRVARNKVTYYLELWTRFQWLHLPQESTEAGIQTESGERSFFFICGTSAPSGMVPLPSSLLLSFHFSLHRNIEKELSRRRYYFTSSNRNPPNWPYKDYCSFFPKISTAIEARKAKTKTKEVHILNFTIVFQYNSVKVSSATCLSNELSSSLNLCSTIYLCLYRSTNELVVMSYN